MTRKQELTDKLKQKKEKFIASLVESNEYSIEALVAYDKLKRENPEQIPHFCRLSENLSELHRDSSKNRTQHLTAHLKDPVYQFLSSLIEESSSIIYDSVKKQYKQDEEDEFYDGGQTESFADEGKREFIYSLIDKLKNRTLDPIETEYGFRIKEYEHLRRLIDDATPYDNSTVHESVSLDNLSIYFAEFLQGMPWDVNNITAFKPRYD